MAIIATASSQEKRELIPAGTYLARCYSMTHIGTTPEVIQGTVKELNKVRVGWELPTELKVFKEENGEQPLVISKEYTLSLSEKANLRIMLDSWRGVKFTEEQAQSFDITKLLGVACLINIIHNPSKSDPTKIYEEVKSITPLMRGQICPPQINPTFEFNYTDKFSWEVFDKFPNFIKEKMMKSKEFASLPARNVELNQPSNHDLVLASEQDGDQPPF